MNPRIPPRTLVLAISGHDPSGGAGLQADIETVTALGGRCATLVTATTAQNSARFVSVYPQPAEQLAVQARLLFEDMSFDACKIGLLGACETVECVAGILKAHNNLPVVLDPVSHAGAGTWSAGQDVLRTIREKLLPLASIVTPNLREARELTGHAEPASAAAGLLGAGASAVLITGTDEVDPLRPEVITHRLYLENMTPVEFSCPRIPGEFHGSGCTLSAAIATFLARGMKTQAAVAEALGFTWSALREGARVGRGQWHPDRGAQNAPLKT